MGVVACGVRWLAIIPAWLRLALKRKTGADRPKSRSHGWWKRDWMFSWLVVPRVGNRQRCGVGLEASMFAGRWSVDGERETRDRGRRVVREGRAFIGRQCGANRAAEGGRKQNGASKCWLSYGGGVYASLSLPRGHGNGQGGHAVGQLDGRGAWAHTNRGSTGSKGRLHQTDPGGVGNRK